MRNFALMACAISLIWFAGPPCHAGGNRLQESSLTKPSAPRDIRSQIDLDTALHHLDSYVTKIAELDPDDQKGKTKATEILDRADAIVVRYLSDPTFAVPQAWSVHATVIILKAGADIHDPDQAALTLAVLRHLTEKGTLPFEGDKRKALSMLNAIAGVRDRLDQRAQEVQRIDQLATAAVAGNAEATYSIAKAVLRGRGVVASQEDAIRWLHSCDADSLLRFAAADLKDDDRDCAKLALALVSAAKDIRGDLELIAISIKDARTPKELEDVQSTLAKLRENTKGRSLAKSVADRFDSLTATLQLRTAALVDQDKKQADQEAANAKRARLQTARLEMQKRHTIVLERLKAENYSCTITETGIDPVHGKQQFLVTTFRVLPNQLREDVQRHVLDEDCVVRSNSGQLSIKDVPSK